MTTMTLSGVLTDTNTVLTQFSTYLAIGVAIPLGLALIGRIKKWVTKR